MNTAQTLHATTNAEDLITRFTQVITRQDGSQVKLVARGGGLTLDPAHSQVDVFKRDSEDQNWHLCSDRPHPDWRTMSVDEYKRRGRPEKLQTASFGEMVRASRWIGQHVSALAQCA